MYFFLPYNFIPYMLSAISVREIIPGKKWKEFCLCRIAQWSTGKGKKARRKNGSEELYFLRYNAMWSTSF
jgi:hypothetical protein